MPCRLPTAVLLLALVARAGEVVETEHYRLDWEGERAAAEEMARLLEAAWKPYAAYFKAKPKLGKDERLKVRFFADREGWAQAITADGATPPDGAGGYYGPGSETAYLFRQPTTYYTRVLMLHEAAHQFHYLAKTGNKSPVAEWYTEGVAEYLSWHHWDGAELDLGVLPAVSLKHYSGVALRELRTEGFDLEAVVEGKTSPSRAIAWALVRHLATGREGKPHPKYETFRRKMDGGVSPAPLFWKMFGRPPAFGEELDKWLAKEQQPWVQVFNEWLPLGPNRLRGFAPVVSVVRVAEPVEFLKGTLEVPKERTMWLGGPMLHFTDENDFSVAMINRTGQMRVARRQGARWQIMEQGEGPPPSADGNYRFEVFRKGDKVYLMFEGGLSYGPYELPGHMMGLGVEKCDLVFRDLEWR